MARSKGPLAAAVGPGDDERFPFSVDDERYRAQGGNLVGCALIVSDRHVAEFDGQCFAHNRPLA